MSIPPPGATQPGAATQGCGFFPASVRHRVAALAGRRIPRSRILSPLQGHPPLSRTVDPEDLPLHANQAGREEGKVPRLAPRRAVLHQRGAGDAASAESARRSRTARPPGDGCPATLRAAPAPGGGPEAGHPTPAGEGARGGDPPLPGKMTRILVPKRLEGGVVWVGADGLYPRSPFRLPSDGPGR